MTGYSISLEQTSNDYWIGQSPCARLISGILYPKFCYTRRRRIPDTQGMYWSRVAVNPPINLKNPQIVESPRQKWKCLANRRSVSVLLMYWSFHWFGLSPFFIQAAIVGFVLFMSLRIHNNLISVLFRRRDNGKKYSISPKYARLCTSIVRAFLRSKPYIILMVYCMRSMVLSLVQILSPVSKPLARSLHHHTAYPTTLSWTRYDLQDCLSHLTFLALL